MSEVRDEIVASRTSNSNGPVSRPIAVDAVDGVTGASKPNRSHEVSEQVRETGRAGRQFKESTQKMFEALDNGAPVDEVDEDASTDSTDGDGVPEADESAREEAGAAADVVPDEEGQPQVDEIHATAARLEESNKNLLAELETARKTPRAERSERETALLAAESAYVDEGSVPALRKFIGIIISAAPDSKEVDAELSGLYADLTARELNVPLNQSQQAIREAARARLALARDKRERKAESEKPSPVNSDEIHMIEQASKYVDNLLATKGQSGTSIADEFPMLMNLARDFDGLPPSTVLAKAIKHEYTIGTLSPQTSETDAIRLVAQKIEKHYDAVAANIEKARTAQTKRTTTTAPTKAANATSTEQRQSTGARTITNATASVAPGTTPKTKQKIAAPAEKTRSDFKSDKAWRDHLLSKHFKD